MTIVDINYDDQEFLYRSIVLGETLKTFQRCCIDWSQSNTNQFKAELVKDDVIWEFFITNHQAENFVVLDIHKNNELYYSFNSHDSNELLEIYLRIEGDVGALKDSIILNDIAKYPNCGCDELD